MNDWRESMEDHAYAVAILDRITSHCRLTESGCWEWTRYITPYGYGGIGIKSVMVTVHRVTYHAFIGPVPEGLQLDHLCRNRACCNPWHLEPVTPLENTLRGIGPALTRRRCGERTHCKRGHEYTPENTYMRTDRRGWSYRTCIKCRAIMSRPYQRARRERIRRERNV